MFKGASGLKNPMALMQGMDKIKKAVKEGGQSFENHEKEHTFQNGLIKIKTRGDNIVRMNLSSDEVKEFMNDDIETFEDILSAAINSIRVDLVDLRTQFIIDKAKELKVPPQLMNMLNKENILDSLI